ncbi:6-phospho-beta-glucosidase [Spiroplasma sabaudiense Ar-1343]|uniref:6-phospho-beta-glucosidase n=1 Tax=Spiroplasma sabaudiense Ar-1343 TaxID=1276257 RepID=W6AAC5_9MOLU|nr:glycoside hydrolase family 1 protein [Spiroplasma sabaudiense]AHI53790.1 6-phospho-beta-glucosidase [Spiroplasma sabaudiense Ar-1343]
MLKFPKDFQLGASFSAMQTEGKGTTKIGKLTMDTYFEEHRELFYQQVGPELTSDIMNHYVDDIAKFKEIGLDSIRTGFSWARLFPDGVNVNLEAVSYYHKFIQEFKKNNIKLYMTMFHFDMPMWAHELGAWASREVIDKFVSYCEFVFQEFGDEVDYYVTFNEPLVTVFEGYTGVMHYPAINDPKQAVQQGYGIFLAHAKVVKAFRKFKLQAPIGVVYNWNFTHPYSQSEADVKAARIYDAYVNRGPLNIMVSGTIDPVLVETLKEFNVLPKYSKQELEVIKETKVDFLGINYYFPCRVQATPNKQARWVLETMKIAIPPTAKINPHRGWEIYPEGLYEIAMAIKTELNNIPWYIAENGMGVENEAQYRGADGIINDTYRIDYLNDHLTQVKKGLDEGSNCFGYHLWTALDCWSFRNTYKNRYGLIEVNLADQSRKLKQSAYWYQSLINNKAK